MGEKYEKELENEINKERRNKVRKNKREIRRKEAGAGMAHAENCALSSLERF